MAVFKNFWNFIQDKMLGTGEAIIRSEDLPELVDREKLTELMTYEFALCTGINIIANALSACEIRTFVRNKEVHGDEYYLWNYSPHYNYNANEFLQKIVWNLIYKGTSAWSSRPEAGSLWRIHTSTKCTPCTRTSSGTSSLTQTPRAASCIRTPSRSPSRWIRCFSTGSTAGTSNPSWTISWRDTGSSWTLRWTNSRRVPANEAS